MKIYLASHDYISTPEPRECVSTGEEVTVNSPYGKKLFKVFRIEPVLPGRFVESETDINALLLAPCTSDTSWSDVGKQVVMVDIYATGGLISSRMSFKNVRKVGVGTVHASLDEAREFAPGKGSVP